VRVRRVGHDLTSHAYSFQHNANADNRNEQHYHKRSSTSLFVHQHHLFLSSIHEAEYKSIAPTSFLYLPCCRNDVPNLKPLLKNVLADITPDKNERASTLQRVNAFLKELNASLKKNKCAAKAVLGGSYAKDTWLRGDYDVDVFVQFGQTHKKDDLSTLLAKALKAKKAERIHGSRDYFWVKDQQFTFEIVPVLEVQKPEQAQNVTDFSPHHVTWVNKNGAKYKNDIRLFKKFCKAQGLYGAESYIRGFSGHVVDILVTYYKGFVPLLKAVTGWKPKTIVDYYHHYDKKALFVLNQSKIQGPLIIIDPVQKDRNAAAALIQEKYDGLIAAAKKFLAKPSQEFFVETGVDFGKLAKKGHVVRVCITAPTGKEDVVGTKLLHAFEYTKRFLEDFTLIASGWKWNKDSQAEFWYVVKQRTLPPTMIHPGPPLEFTRAVAAFKKAHKKTFVKGDRLMAEIKRPYTTPEQALAAAAQDEYVAQREITLKPESCTQVRG
jgi:tRNA nucleotidyltransferase (CCA-adding enzyme)